MKGPSGHALDALAKWSRGTHQSDGRGTSWLKIKNPDYSQMTGRRELFESKHLLGHRSRTKSIGPVLTLR